jgi:hypothetical protein|tara:strand:+ start:7267 stop:9138 length:1872 start_codon:yes stop_codon:yes gene_type:complete
MKPLNLDNKPCSPISSNCVIWQGPDIDCIKICNGDSVSDVVAALATELCTVLDQINVSSYDLTCLGFTSACPPKDFEALIQFLINKICDLESVPTDTPKDASGCPDCIISVASCFIEGTTTNMQLVDYVQAIANKVCALVDKIADLQTQIDGIDIRVTALENVVPPSLLIPSIPTGCLDSVIPGAPATETIDIVLDYLVNDATIGYCATIETLWGSSGSAADLAAVLNPVCITASSASIVDGNDAGVGTMSSAYPGPTGWVTTPLTLAQSIQNLWIAICDLRNITTVAFTNTDTISFTQNTGLPDYNFSANLNQPHALIREVGVNVLGGGGSNINSASGLWLSEPGYVVGNNNGDARWICGGAGVPFKFPVAAVIYDTFTVPVTTSGIGLININEDGIYDLSYKIQLSAPITTLPLPDAPSEGAPFGTGKGWYGGDNVSSNDQPRVTVLAAAGTSPGAGYTDGIFTVVYPSGTITIQITTVGGGDTSIASIIVLNTTGSFDSSDLIAVPIAQSGSDSSARIQITALTKPTPKVTVIAAIQDISGGATCINYAEMIFAPNTATSKCVINGTQLGIQLTAGAVLEVKFAIVVNDESGGLPNSRWDYLSSYLAADDSYELFVRKMK